MARQNDTTALRGRYGPWALVAGASDGLGAAFAESLSALGFSLVLVARRDELLQTLAARLEASAGIGTRCVVADLADSHTIERIQDETKDLDLGLLVYNAAFAPIGAFGTRSIEELMGVVDVNVRGPLVLLRSLLPRFTPRERSGVILMSSLAGSIGSPLIATYAASKAFTTVLANGLSDEFQAQGIDITACCAGAIRTPGYLAAAGAGASTTGAGGSRAEAPGTLDASQVVAAALGAIGRKPIVVPGLVNKAARFFMTRILPNRAALRIMAASTRDLSEGGTQ